ncbi:MGDG synthase family glycosyltransferase, partial [Staphylococcus epidermidis]
KNILIITASFPNRHIQLTQTILNQFNHINLNHLSLIQHHFFIQPHPIITSISNKYYINTFKYFTNTYKPFYYTPPNHLHKSFYKYYRLNKLIN